MEDTKLQCQAVGGRINSQGGWHDEDPCEPNGRVHKHGNQGKKIAATERLTQKYDIYLYLLMKLNFNWSKVDSSANLASWFTNKKREMRCVMAHNIAKTDALFGKHQPEGTRMLCRHEYLQYARKPSGDPRGLGRWCSWPFFCWPFFCNPMHVARIVVAYRLCASKVEGLKTVYQQKVQYIQSRGLPYNVVELFDHDLCK
jgi:hypothetical protein